MVTLISSLSLPICAPLKVNGWVDQLLTQMRLESDVRPSVEHIWPWSTNCSANQSGYTCFLIGTTGKSDVTEQLDHAVRDANEKLLSLHNLERQNLRSALIEQRSRLCLFVSGLKPVMVSCPP